MTDRIRVGVNGFGRIGRQFARIALARGGFDIVAVNDLTDPPTLAHLFKYDSNYGSFGGTVRAEGQELVLGDDRLKVLAEPDPAKLPWKDLGVDIVVESTGRFTQREKAARHIDAGGAKRVIISAPAKNEDLTVVMGVNEDRYDPARHHVVSNASCTTNCLAPVAKVLNDRFSIVRGLMTTVHAYTNDQRILDLPHEDLRRARAAALSIIPTTTGAAKAVALVLPELKGKLNGFAMRVPTSTVSVVDLVAELGQAVTVEAVNDAFKQVAAGSMGRVLAVTDEPLVSIDFKGSSASATVDLLSTMVMGDSLVKVVAWYDNEWGYSARLVDLVAFIAAKGL